MLTSSLITGTRDDVVLRVEPECAFRTRCNGHPIALRTRPWRGSCTARSLRSCRPAGARRPTTSATAASDSHSTTRHRQSNSNTAPSHISAKHGRRTNVANVDRNFPRRSRLVDRLAEPSGGVRASASKLRLLRLIGDTPGDLTSTVTPPPDRADGEPAARAAQVLTM